MDLYREHILDHVRSPRGKGLREGVGICAQRFNRLCGDVVTLQAAVVDGVVTTVRFEGHGCVVSQAVASMLTEFVEGMSLSQVCDLDESTLRDLLGTPLPLMRVSCGMLALEALQEAVCRC